MAAYITHIALTDKIFDKHFSDKNKAEFFIGTSFPDIRYLGVIEREKTHNKNVNLSLVKQAPSSFMSGLFFHSLVDQVREKFVKKNGLYSLLPSSPFLTQAVKIYEDQILFNKVKNWDEIIGFFSKVLPEEQSFGIKEKDLKKWHFLLQKYFQKKPNDENIRLFVSTLGKPKEMSEEIIRLIRVIENKPKIKDTVEDFYNKFDQIITV
jgi:hypothetical protein